MTAYKRLSVETAAVLFIDHQTGLNSLVRDYSPAQFTANVLALADVAKYFKLPTILTTSFESGPNGPIIPELKIMFPEAPFIARPGQINAWDSEEFVAAVKKTGRKQLIMCGIITDVCVAFPALSAIEAGYDVFIDTGSSGTLNEACRYATWLRMLSAGAQLMHWFSIASELQRDWRNDPIGFGKVTSQNLPEYKHLMTSFDAQKKK
jgi:nicotinamidase-related amidase